MYNSNFISRRRCLKAKELAPSITIIYILQLFKNRIKLTELITRWQVLLPQKKIHHQEIP